MRLIDGRRWIGPSIVRQGETFSDPTHIIDDEMDVWNELWQRHDKISTPVLDGVVWDSLAVSSCHDISRSSVSQVDAESDKD